MKNDSYEAQYTRLVNKTEDYIEAHLRDKIKLKDVASHVGMSEYHFHRIFKMYSKETLNEFILRFKIERSAIYLVMNKDITITQVALDYGFSESSSYSRAFKRHYKVSPSQFLLQQDMSSNDE